VYICGNTILYKKKSLLINWRRMGVWRCAPRILYLDVKWSLDSFTFRRPYPWRSLVTDWLGCWMWSIARLGSAPKKLLGTNWFMLMLECHYVTCVSTGRAGAVCVGRSCVTDGTRFVPSRIAAGPQRITSCVICTVGRDSPALWCGSLGSATAVQTPPPTPPIPSIYYNLWWN
jgi:hypothetical protein